VFETSKKLNKIC